MKILIDIGHPGHVHLFKFFAKEMISNGHNILFTCREKEFEIDLLKYYGFNYVSFGKKYISTTGKIYGLLKFDFLEVIHAIKFQPDVFISHGSPYAAHAAFLLRKVHISLEDTGNAEQVKLYLPFTRHVLTSVDFHVDYGKKQIRYSGFHELAYLHPKRFIPNVDVFKDIGLKYSDKYFFIRFVSWNASHDVGENGFTYNEKIAIINFLKTQGHVIISSEKELPPELVQYKFTLHPSKAHDVMSSATLFIGEGATMASECAMLGTPAIYVNSIEAGTIKKQESYGLVFHFKNGKGVLEKIKELMEDSSLKLKMNEARTKLLQENIDVTAFMVWFIENYPKSAAIMKENPNYQFNFK